MKNQTNEKKIEEVIEQDKPKKNVFVKWNPKGFFYVDVDSISNKLIEKYQFRTIYGKKTEVIYCYDKQYGIFKPNGLEIIKIQSERLLESYAKNNPIQEIIGKIKRLTSFKEEDFKPELYKIPFLNGCYNLNTKKLEQHSQKNNFRFLIPIQFLETAECPKFKKFLSEILYYEDIPVIQEWFGFCLYREYFIKKALIGVGETDTAKTTLNRILNNFMGEENVCGLSLQKITGGSDFNKLSLKNKHLNSYDDLSFKDLVDESAFKIATGGGYISAEEKFGDYQQFKNFAKLFFMTNCIPPTKNSQDMAYYNRWIVINFDVVISEEDKNPFLADEISQENPGILNWALEGLFRLLQNKRFSYKKSPDEVRAIMDYSGNPLIAFGTDCLIQYDKNKISKEDMFIVYKKWAEENKRPSLSKEQLGRQLSKWLPFIQAREENGTRWWVSVDLKEKYKPFIKKSVESVEQKEIEFNDINLGDFT